MTFTFPHNSLRPSDIYIYVYIYASVKWAIIDSDNDPSPVLHQAIGRTNVPTYCWLNPLKWTSVKFESLYSDFWLLFKKLHLKVPSTKWRPFYHCLSMLSVLTLNVWGPIYLGLTRPISWLLMPWRRKETGHQQPWYWLCRICRSWSYLRKDFKYMCHINVE